jgi:CHASE3 domain sensor protein
MKEENLKKARILIVDDEQVKIELLECTLQPAGYLISDQEHSLKSYGRGTSETGERFRSLGRLTVDNPKQQGGLALLETLVTRWVQITAQYIEERRRSGINAARLLIFRPDGPATIEDIRKLTADTASEENALLVTKSARERAGFWKKALSC